jgi:hypothetical protein
MLVPNYSATIFLFCGVRCENWITQGLSHLSLLQVDLNAKYWEVLHTYGDIYAFSVCWAPFETQIMCIFRSAILRILLGCGYFQERVLKVLHVWTNRFLFSNACVNGLRTIFLRPRNSRVPPFYSLNGDARPTKEKWGGSNSMEIAINVLEGLYGDMGKM